MKPLPRLMVAPNGARKMKSDHPTLPITLDEVVETAIACHAEGADGLHLHLRDAEGGHVLNADMYSHALSVLTAAVPDMILQITTEAVGIYTPAEQRAIVGSVKPEFVSISIAEMFSDGNHESVTQFYRECANHNIAIQHIVYGEDDLNLLKTSLDNGTLAHGGLQLLFVLGRYTEGQQSSPDDLTLFTDWLKTNNVAADWAVCAFGRNETACLKAALSAGGKARVGFENSFFNADGSIANNNQDRVKEMAQVIKSLDQV